MYATARRDGAVLGAEQLRAARQRRRELEQLLGSSRSQRPDHCDPRGHWRRPHVRAPGRRHGAVLGVGDSGQRGDGTFNNISTVPAAVVGITGAVAVAARGYHSCALLGDGTVWCWGRNSDGAGDRKSTRLNSSHGYISYAVFCLKKKKTYRQ